MPIPVKINDRPRRGFAAPRKRPAPRSGSQEVVECLSAYPTDTGGSVDLALATREEGDRTVVQVTGEVDVYTAPKLREQLVSLVDAGRYHIIVDLDAVEFLDSTGLGVLVGGLKRVRTHDGSLRLVCSQERILKIFRITGLTKVFPIHDSVEDALAAS